MKTPQGYFLRRGDYSKIARMCQCSSAYVRFVLKNNYKADTPLYDKVIYAAGQVSLYNEAERMKIQLPDD